MPIEQNKREQFIIRRIGGTTYKVRVVFNESGGETMEDKILRIVRNDMVTNDGCAHRTQQLVPILVRTDLGFPDLSGIA